METHASGTVTWHNDSLWPRSRGPRIRASSETNCLSRHGSGRSEPALTGSPYCSVRATNLNSRRRGGRFAETQSLSYYRKAENSCTGRIRPAGWSRQRLHTVPDRSPGLFTKAVTVKAVSDLKGFAFLRSGWFENRCTPYRKSPTGLRFTKKATPSNIIVSRREPDNERSR